MMQTMLFRATALAATLFFASGCTMTDRADHFDGLPNPEGDSFVHLNVTGIGANTFILFPTFGYATLDETAGALAAEARDAQATSLRVVQSDSTNLWWILPPFSFLICPVVNNIAADASR